MIRASDLYPEFVGARATNAAKTLLARTAASGGRASAPTGSQIDHRGTGRNSDGSLRGTRDSSRSGGSSSSAEITPEYTVTLPGNGGRRSSNPKIIVLHNTDGPNQAGIGDLKATESTLRQRGFSVHVVNDSEGKCARLCPDDVVAYHAAGANVNSLGIEQVGKIGQPLSAYTDAQIDNTAKWIGYWSKKYNIPIKRSKTNGICAHHEVTDTTCMTGPYPWDKVLAKAAEYSGGVVVANDPYGSTPTATVSGIDAEGMQTIGTAAAFAAVLEGPTAAERLEADIGGARSYMNDKPLIEFVDEVCTASMRHYQSMPDGRFYAFFPDYFGSFNHRAPYWEISDIEITDFNIYLSDDELYTHVYVVGDTMPLGSPPSSAMVGPDFLNKLRSNGVVTIFDAFNLNWLGSVSGGENDKVFADATAFLNKYGVRPYYEKAPQIHSSYYELFVAYQRFMFLWARQFLTQCEFTFMPEIYPGGRVSFKDHGMICYVDSVEHEFDYESGFTTTAQLSAPSADVNSKVPFSMGMVRPESGGVQKGAEE